MEVAAGRHGTDASMETVYLTYADDPSAEEQEAPQRYWGSVRFFKHIILGTIALMILVPTVLAACFAVQVRSLSSQVLRLQGELDTLSAAGGAGQDGTAPGGDPAGTELPAGPASEEPDYTKLYPELYSDAEEYATEDVEHSVYLTFDDGPSPRTDEILEDPGPVRGQGHLLCGGRFGGRGPAAHAEYRGCGAHPGHSQLLP